MSKPVLHLRVIDAEKESFDGEIEALSSFNTDGPFDILPFHSNFISIIKDKVVIHSQDKQEQEIPFKVAVLKALDNDLTVFIGIEQIDISTQPQ